MAFSVFLQLPDDEKQKAHNHNSIVQTTFAFQFHKQICCVYVWRLPE
jgi:hypothetical protein